MFVNETFYNAIYDRELAPWIRREFCDFLKKYTVIFSPLHRDFRTALLIIPASGVTTRSAEMDNIMQRLDCTE